MMTSHRQSRSQKNENKAVGARFLVSAHVCALHSSLFAHSCLTPRSVLPPLHFPQGIAGVFLFIMFVPYEWLYPRDKGGGDGGGGEAQQHQLKSAPDQQQQHRQHHHHIPHFVGEEVGKWVSHGVGALVSRARFRATRGAMDDDSIDDEPEEQEIKAGHLAWLKTAEAAAAASTSADALPAEEEEASSVSVEADAKSLAAAAAAEERAAVRAAAAAAWASEARPDSSSRFTSFGLNDSSVVRKYGKNDQTAK